jgi:hypothetical protein
MSNSIEQSGARGFLVLRSWRSRLPPALSRGLVAAALSCVACGDEATIIGAGGAAAQPGEGLPGAPTNPAILLVGQVYSPEAYNTYVGVLPEVPEGEVSFDTFREFGNANAYSHAGYVFVEEDGVVQRFSVGEDLQLVDGPRFSWRDFGFAEINTTSTVFVSTTRAYTFAPSLDLIIVWSPEEMALTGTIPLGLPERPADMETFAYDGYLVGDRVVWNVFSGSFDSLTTHPAVTLVIADADSDAPVQVIEDNRCLPGGPSFVDENGDYYVHGGGYFGYFLAYGGIPDAKTCILRMRAGAEQLDPDYLLDYQALTGSYASDPWFHIGGSQYMARAWNPAVPFPESPDEFWDNGALTPLLVDTSAASAAPYSGLDRKSVDGQTRKVDGVGYYQLSDTGYVENGNTDVVALRPDGVQPKFHLNGFLLGLERLR